MSTYWLMLILPVLFGLAPIKFDHNLKNIAFFLFGVTLVILIGFRHEVGGDWDRYLDSAYGIVKGSSFPDYTYLMRGDYGYRALHWFSVHYLNGIYSTNFIGASFFIVGLVRFCRIMPMPWLAIAMSVPFLIVVVAMGYTRQSIALGFLMWALVDLLNGKSNYYYLWVILGSFFHLTVLVMLPIATLFHKKTINLFILSVFLLVIMYWLFWGQISHMFYYYITIEFHHSDGAVARLFMTFISAVLFFLYRREFKEVFYDERLWFVFSIISIFLLPLAFYYSTFIDRIAIYFIPLQLVVFSRIPILIESKINRTIFVFFVIALYLSSLFIWLFFGNFSNHWLPYQNILLVVGA
jgi:hypothetical protein